MFFWGLYKFASVLLFFWGGGRGGDTIHGSCVYLFIIYLFIYLFTYLFIYFFFCFFLGGGRLEFAYLLVTLLSIPDAA